MDIYRLVWVALQALEEIPRELQIVDARSLVERRYPSVSTDRPAVVGPLGDGVSCRSVCSRLSLAYPESHGVVLIQGVDGPMSGTVSTTLGQAGTVSLDEGVALLYVPPLPHPSSLESFQGTVAHLRAPDGCPWDREQTHRSLRQGFQEEAYEVLDALDRGDLEALKEELGDILLHVLLQVQIAIERNEFRMGEVIGHVNHKIVHRHPHVFGGLNVNGVEEVLVNWETLKQQEKEAKTEDPSALDGVAPSMPALARAQSIQRHVDRLGVFDTTVEQLALGAAAQIDRLAAVQEMPARAHMLGNLLFDLAYLARKLGIDAESALREANTRFEDRYRATERELHAHE